MRPIDLRQKVSGKYTFKKVNKVTGKETELPVVATNLLLEPFFRTATSTVSGGAVYMSCIVVGSGNTPPAVSNTGLESFVAASATQQGPVLPNIVNSTVYPRYCTRSFVKRFNGTALAGANLSEVGVAITNTAGQVATAATPLASRALIVDSMGNPTTIQVLADEFLDVTYSMTTYAIDGVIGSFDINVLGTVETFDYEIRPICMNNASLWRGAEISSGIAVLAAICFPTASNIPQYSSQAQSVTVFEDPGATNDPAQPGTGLNFSSYKTAPVWDAVTMTSTGTLTLPLNSGNFPGGIRSFLLNFAHTGNPSGNRILGAHRMMLDRPLMKTSDHVFEFPITIGLSNAAPPV